MTEQLTPGLKPGSKTSRRGGQIGWEREKRCLWFSFIWPKTNSKFACLSTDSFPGHLPFHAVSQERENRKGEHCLEFTGSKNHADGAEAQKHSLMSTCLHWPHTSMRCHNLPPLKINYRALSEIRQKSTNVQILFAQITGIFQSTDFQEQFPSAETSNKSIRLNIANKYAIPV